MKSEVILCVDDEKMVLDSLITQLRNYFGSRYLYESAENAEEAWDVIKEMTEEGYTFALVISDWLMPFEKGDKFLIDVTKFMPTVPLIMLSGQVDDESLARAKKYANLYCFIRKPWDKTALLNEVEKAMMKVVG